MEMDIFVQEEATAQTVGLVPLVSDANAKVRHDNVGAIKRRPTGRRAAMNLSVKSFFISLTSPSRGRAVTAKCGGWGRAD